MGLLDGGAAGEGVKREEVTEVKEVKEVEERDGGGYRPLISSRNGMRCAVIPSRLDVAKTIAATI